MIQVVVDNLRIAVVETTVTMFERETKGDENVATHTTLDLGVPIRLRMDNDDDGDEESCGRRRKRDVIQRRRIVPSLFLF